jgi:hypothetical protein
MSTSDLVLFIAELPQRVTVILKSLVTWAVAAQTGLTVLLPQVEFLGPDVVRYGTVALAWLALAIVTLRRLTPVGVEQRGVLPADR